MDGTTIGLIVIGGALLFIAWHNGLFWNNPTLLTLPSGSLPGGGGGNGGQLPSTLMSREMVPMWDTLNNMGLDRARGGNISVNIPRRGI